MSTPFKGPFAGLDPRLPLPSLAAPSPFDAGPADVPADAPEGSYTYALVQSAPSVPAEQCEIDAAAVEIVVRWGATTLHVAHLAPPRPFVVGEASDSDPVDFQLPADRLGSARLSVVRKAAEGPARAVLPAGARGTVTVAGEVVKIADLAARNIGQPSAESAGAVEIPLHAGTRARFEIGGFELEIAGVNAGRKVAGRLSFDRRGLPFQVMSTALHLGLLGAAAIFMPPLALASEDAPSHDQIDSLRRMLSTTAEREAAAVADPSGDPSASRDTPAARESTGRDDSKGSVQGRGARNKGGAPGPLGSDAAPLSRAEAIALARKFGLIGLLQDGPGAAPASAWSAPTGADLRAGNPFGGGDLDRGGGGELDLTGVGETGGTDGRGIDLDRIGTTSGVPGPGGFRRRPAGWGDGHRPQGPAIQTKELATSGQIPREIIQRVVRQSFGRFRLCYESGLRKNPGLAGRVSVRFVIGRDGSVMSAANGGSDLPDAGVVACVVSSFRGLQFPQVEGASAATVVYPIVLSPAK